MGLETGTYIDDLVTTNPTSTDLVKFGDDHIRLLKTVLKNSFPEVDGAINVSTTEFNYLAGVTSAIQTQLNAKEAADAGLTAIAGLAVTNGNVIVGNGATWVAESGATARTSLGLGTGDSPQFTGVNVGSASDTTLTRKAPGVLGVENKAAITHASTSYTSSEVTVSTSSPSGGSDGDIWLKY